MSVVDKATIPILDKLGQTRAHREAAQRWLGLLVPALLVWFVITVLYSRPGVGLEGRGLVVTLAVVAFVLGTLGSLGKIPRLKVYSRVFVVFMVASSAVLMWAQPNGPGAIGVFVGLLFVSRHLSGRTAVIFPVVGFVFLEVFAVIVHGGAVSPVLLVVLGSLYGMMFLATRLADANEQAERLLIELEQSRAAELLSAGLAERQRLAREMHDVLAHSLSGLMLQLEGARMLADENPCDPRLSKVIDRAHQLGKTGLEEARSAIGMLRDDELPGPELLDNITTQFQENHAIPCLFTVSGKEHKLDSEVRLALYRVTQEALTNVTKHARHPERVELHLVYEPHTVRLTVEDFSTTNAKRPTPDGNSGYGLTGMRERAELLGGKLITETTRSGFRVELKVPT